MFFYEAMRKHYNCEQLIMSRSGGATEKFIPKYCLKNQQHENDRRTMKIYAYYTKTPCTATSGARKKMCRQKIRGCAARLGLCAENARVNRAVFSVVEQQRRQRRRRQRRWSAENTNAYTHTHIDTYQHTNTRTRSHTEHFTRHRRVQTGTWSRSRSDA